MTGMPTQNAEVPKFEISASRQFSSWMHEQSTSLAFTTYQAGRLFFIGLQDDGRLDIFNRKFARCMGMHVASDKLWLSSLYQLWRFDNALDPGQTHQGYDRLYVPQLAYTTGDIDIHDVSVDTTGKPIFVNTLFSCLATASEKYSFEPLWKPPFISRLAAEDRCHLNGLATENGVAKFVTAVGTSDVIDGWRDQKVGGGVVFDVVNNEKVAGDLCMPHSPRLHNDRLWILNSGHGEFGYIDLQRGSFEPICFVPGYGRGLNFIDKFAVIGLSGPRKNRTFSGLPLDDKLKAQNLKSRCGLFVVDLESGDIVHWLRIDGVVDELYDVGALPGITRPMALGLESDEIRRVLSIAPKSDGAPI